MGWLFRSEDEHIAAFERMGEDGVRLLVKHPPETLSFSGRFQRIYAIRWLSKYDYEARLRIESSQAESLDIAKSAKDAAWRAAEAAREAALEAGKANMIGTAALIAAVIAIAVSILSLFLRG